ncbi:hypothetical protein EMIHUDRAFT_354083, partial [Emiliania huxleyi CCMP1516]
LGGALSRIAATEALTLSASMALRQTFFHALMAACAVPAYIIKACDVLDNPWGVARGRPVTLARRIRGVGVLARDVPRARAAGIVQHAVLLGLPASSDPARWRRLRRVVAGRLVNCYRPDDLVLSLAHRAAQLKAFGVAGLSPVPAGAGVESYNVSRLVRAHHRYRFTVGPVLRHVGLTED